MTKRNTHLDLIKCIACFAVVGLHAVGMKNYTWYYLCGCGVPLFFLVNGYLMFGKTEITYRYLFHKILQILKIVFLWNLLIALPVLVFRQKLVNPFALSIQSLLQKGYLWHFWFFGALLLLYLLLPLLHRLFLQKPAILRLIWYLLLGVCLTMSILSMTKGYPLHAYVPQSLRLWIWLFFFISGGLMHSFLPKLQKLPLLLHAVLCFVAAFLNNQALKYIGLHLTASRLADYYYDYATSILFYLLLFSLLMRLPLTKAPSAAIILCSNLTMGIFILHPILLTGLSGFLTISGDGLLLLFWIALTLTCGIITFLMAKLPLIRELIHL